jgi:hypothetical protein
METFIRHLTARYRLTASAQAERERLDKVLGVVLGDALEQALFRVGIAEHEEICIRQIIAPVRLRLSQADSALVLRWSVALAEAIQQATERGPSAEVVRYGSRVQALLDLAVSITRGDYRRAWAWQQLGLWQVGEQPSEREAVRGFVQALSTEAQLVAPILRSLASFNRLEFFTARFATEQWVLLAHAALVAAGAPTHLLDGVDDDEPTAFAPLTSAFLRQTAHRLLAASSLTTALESLVTQSPDMRRAIATLIVLETEPNALRTSEDTSRALIYTIGEALEILAVIAATPTTADQESAFATRDMAAVKDVEADAPDVAAAANDAETSVPDSMTTTQDERVSVRTDAGFRPGRKASPEDGNVVGRRALAGNRSSTPDPQPEEHSPQTERFASDEADELALPLVRREALTRFGGLLFLLGVVEDLGLPDDIQTQPALATRLFRWVLFQLALTLIPAEVHDPAVLAFAGLSPDATPPSIDEEPPTEAEESVIVSYAARIREAVCERLDRCDPHEALQFVCHRHATVVVDPGWIEVRFALVNLSTEIRRAALDLNPDYLPWLGVVVKFVYE